MEIILLTLLGTVISIVIGTLWYSPATSMGRLHMRYVGFDSLTTEEQKAKMEEMKPQMWKYYLGQMALSALTSFATVFIVSMSIKNGVPTLMAIAFVIFNWLCFMVPVVGSNIIWGPCEREIAWRKLVYDSGSFLVTILVIALLTSAVV